MIYILMLCKLSVIAMKCIRLEYFWSSFILDTASEFRFIKRDFLQFCHKSFCPSSQLLASTWLPMSGLAVQLTSSQINKSHPKHNKIRTHVRNTASCCLFFHSWHPHRILPFTHWSYFSETEKPWNLKPQQKCVPESCVCVSYGYCISTHI